jgi:hypothetical protein
VLVLPIRLLFPDARRLLAFRPEDLALALVEYFKVLPSQDEWMALRCASHWSAGYPADARDAVAALLVDAWRWLRDREHLGPVPTSTTYGDRPAADDRAKGNAA